MVNSTYPEGMDYLWIGVDNSGSVAAFFTAGEGPIPSKFIEDFADPTQICDWLDQLPAHEARHALHDVDDFDLLARKGLFVYDWSDVHRVSGRLGGYELVAVPTKPLKSTDSVAAQQLLSPVPVFDRATFGLVPVLIADEFHKCVWP